LFDITLFYRQIKKDMEEEQRIVLEGEVIMDETTVEETVKNTLFNKFVGKIDKEIPSYDSKNI